jgi:hypothetical protein
MEWRFSGGIQIARWDDGVLTENCSFAADQGAVQKPCDLKSLLGTCAEGF